MQYFVNIDPGSVIKCNQYVLRSVSDSGGSGAEDSTWVTVFGFPPAAASYILTQFTQLGTVTRHHNPGSGNWMHLKYQVDIFLVLPDVFFILMSLSVPCGI